MAQIKVQKTEPLLLNKTDLCRSLGISTTAFDKWAVPVHCKKGRECLYTMADVVANRVGNERSKQKSVGEDVDPDKPNLDYERYRLTKAQADGQELKNQKERKEVVEANFCIFVLSRIAAQIAPVLDQIHIRVKRKFPDIPEKTIDAIKAEVIKSQNTAADLADGIGELLDEYLGSPD
ncbi:DNA packaging protein [Shewanella sp. Choline-02u-19]|uniref:terminase small subunit n=1 Tax=unclassified Shewanella TaxID=196818 RepID=UPI000C336D54|nr:MULTISPECIES: terminase small subunit [unclassified Shewanella]PKH62563.1 DNA packaging protein [Shewanella sp. Bg11-22]PKI27926.1 DNA packaging protein [Shewanella sp. Choline-02u-19]